MDEKEERSLRRKAIRMVLRNVSPKRILQKLSRSRAWLYKWRRRFEEKGRAGLRSHSRQPSVSPQQYPPYVRRLVVQARRRLTRSPVGLVGAKAIQRELKHTYALRHFPSTATIQRIVRQAKLTPNGSEAVDAYFPQPTATPCFVLHALDWTARYLEGGTKVFAFHTLDLDTQACMQTISADKSTPTVCFHTLEVWHRLGLPDGLQMDNDAAFCGGYKTPRIFGQFLRLCLYVGVEPIFLPIKEPERNAEVERFHGLWAQAFWNRRHFHSVGQVRRASPAFEQWYAHTYEPPALRGQTPAQAHRLTHRQRLTRCRFRVFPDDLPITTGRVHFIRQVRDDNTISLLNEAWPLTRRLVGQYVWATVVTHQHTLTLYHRPSQESAVHRLKTYEYEIGETVIPLQLHFYRPYRRRNMSTML